MIVSVGFKKYIGAIVDEYKAGILYDKYSILIKGFKVSFSKLAAAAAALN